MKTVTVFSSMESASNQGIAGNQEILSALTQGQKSTAPGPDDNTDDEACIANISPRERMKRLIGGVIPFVLALAILSWQISANIDRLWRLPLFLLFIGAASGFFQWRDKT